MGVGVKVGEERVVMEFQNMIPNQNRIDFYIYVIFSKFVGILKAHHAILNPRQSRCGSRVYSRIVRMSTS